MVTKAARSAALLRIVRLPSGIFFGVSRLPAGLVLTTAASALEPHGKLEPLSFMKQENLAWSKALAPLALNGSKEDGPGMSVYAGC